MPTYDWWVYIVLAIPGVFLFVMNWAAFIHNMRGKKFVSGIPLFGGLWIAVVCLISPCKWLALIGLADPGIWLLIAALVREYFPRRKQNDPENTETEEKNDP
ncbi:MAG: hypothetical protein IK055_00875 [Lachnospiraceae bacterium]|nr:hypothetical protein [Lachnospiraceae bacterium]